MNEILESNLFDQSDYSILLVEFYYLVLDVK